MRDVSRWVWIGLTALSLQVRFVSYAKASEPLTRPTFHCIGLYWKPSEGAPDNLCEVRYRAKGDPQWKEALPLWFDNNQHPGFDAASHQYRGSIVNLLPATEYEINLTLESTGTQRALSTTTWSEEFPIQSFVSFESGTCRSTLHVTKGGSAQDGYVVYGPREGREAVIDVGDQMDSCVRVDASYVILRGLTCKGARRHGIVLGDVANVIIEQCDVSGWGRIQSNGFGVNLDSAIYSESSNLEGVVVQRCRLHHPRSNASAWTQGGHPLGPHAIYWKASKGGHVIRYNEMDSDEEHCFNDIMGEQRNFSYGGFPNRDTDIYCNRLAHCRDDGIESEGANMNVRIWGNHIDSFYMAIGAASTSLGPQYIWRNLSSYSRRGPVGTDKFYRGGAFVKLGTSHPQYSRGRILVLHNTILQPPAPWVFPKGDFSGCESGVNITVDRGYQSNIFCRNNILHVNNYTRRQDSVKDRTGDPSNSYDFDLHNGLVVATSEQHGIRLEPEETPQYDPGNAAGQYALAVGAPGYDMAERIPNFNDQFLDEGPDVGACEHGGAALPVGVQADWTAWLMQWKQAD